MTTWKQAMSETTEYQYDKAGRIEMEVVMTEKFVETTTFEYDKAGRISRKTVVIDEPLDGTGES